MATTFYSDLCASGSGIQPRAGLGVRSITGTYDFTAAWVDEDVAKMVPIPAGAKILDVIMSVPALTDQADVVWAVGDDDEAERFITGATSGRSSTAGTTRLNVPLGHGHEYSADNNINFHITTVPGATAVTSGTITCTVIYTLDL